MPDFLADKLPMLSYKNSCGFGGVRKYYPAYTEEYLKWWRELLYMFSEKYDNHPYLEYVDISGYGIWGEGHHYGMHEEDCFNSNRHAPNAERIRAYRAIVLMGDVGDAIYT